MYNVINRTVHMANILCNLVLGGPIAVFHIAYLPQMLVSYIVIVLKISHLVYKVTQYATKKKTRRKIGIRQDCIVYL